MAHPLLYSGSYGIRGKHPKKEILLRLTRNPRTKQGEAAGPLRGFLKRQKQRIQALFEDHSSRTLYDHRGSIRP